MFEQLLYEQTPVAEPLQDGELFCNYELRSWILSPRLYKILGVSAAVNLLALLVFAQTSLLTMKGCDSPLVSSVCQALDTVYVGTLLFGTDREYVDAAYERTNLGEAEITYIDVSGAAPPFYYPSDYLKYSDPEKYARQQQGENPAFPTDIPGFPGIPTMRPSTGNDLLATKPNFPKPKADVVDGELPSFDDSAVADTKPGLTKRKPGSGKASNVPDRNPDGSIPGIPGSANANTNPTANANTDPTKNPIADNGDPLINKRPFVDLANNVNDLLDKNQVKLESAFVVNASGKLGKDGKFDPKTFRYIQAASNDIKMIDVIKESIEAINDSGYLQYLSGISGRDFSLLLQQDDKSITALVQSEMESDLRANSMKSSLDLLIAGFKLKKSGENADQNDKDDLTLLENAKVETDGKKLIIRFIVPKEIALPMIQRKLAEQKAAPKQPNGNAIVKPNNNSSE
jgi:hypothetical protein